jgi:hypothetical protein
MSATSILPHLKRAHDPLRAYAVWFYGRYIEPTLRLQGLMKIENRSKEMFVIRQLDHERFRAQYARDVRCGLLNFAGENKLLQNRKTAVVSGDGAAVLSYA